jgi:hypothetical protein
MIAVMLKKQIVVGGKAAQSAFELIVSSNSGTFSKPEQKAVLDWIEFASPGNASIVREALIVLTEKGPAEFLDVLGSLLDQRTEETDADEPEHCLLCLNDAEHGTECYQVLGDDAKQIGTMIICTDCYEVAQIRIRKNPYACNHPVLHRPWCIEQDSRLAVYTSYGTSTIDTLRKAVNQTYDYSEWFQNAPRSSFISGLIRHRDQPKVELLQAEKRRNERDAKCGTSLFNDGIVGRGRPQVEKKCMQCAEEFSSRNMLFVHLNENNKSHQQDKVTSPYVLRNPHLSSTKGDHPMPKFAKQS